MQGQAILKGASYHLTLEFGRNCWDTGLFLNTLMLFSLVCGSFLQNLQMPVSEVGDHFELIHFIG